MKPKIYIDGSEGTTGLRIFERVGCRDDIEILTIDPALRKDVDERRREKLLSHFDAAAAELMFLGMTARELCDRLLRAETQESKEVQP